MNAGNITFYNGSGQQALIFWSQGQKGHDISLPANQTSGSINGTLLTIDIVHANQQNSYDLTNNPALLVNAESPYRLTQVAQSGTLLLVISDNQGVIAVEVWPTG
jgi:hypothetical protein